VSGGGRDASAQDAAPRAASCQAGSSPDWAGHLIQPTSPRRKTHVIRLRLPQQEPRKRPALPNSGVACPYTYALACISLAVAAIVNSALSFVPGARRACRVCADSPDAIWHGHHAQIIRYRRDAPCDPFTDRRLMVPDGGAAVVRRRRRVSGSGGAYPGRSCRNSRGSSPVLPGGGRTSVRWGYDDVSLHSEDEVSDIDIGEGAGFGECQGEGVVEASVGWVEQARVEES
jgi:hypothetical protein